MSPNVWFAIAAVVSFGCLLWLVQDMKWRPVPPILTFAVFAIFFRFALSAFHPFTFPPIVGPFSINALYSLLVVGLGFQFINYRLLLLRFLLPIYGLLLLIVISAIYNGSLKESIQSLVKWLFFVVITLAIYESVVRVGRALVLEKLLMAFSVPIILQLICIPLGYNKPTEDSNAISYIGGYNHEAVFSVMLVTALIMAALRLMVAPRPSFWWTAFPLLLAVQVAMANYRTNILSMLMPLLGFLYLHFLHKGLPLAKVGVALGVVAAFFVVATMDFTTLITRFSDISTVAESLGQLIKPPQFYTQFEQDYFSARVYFWSEYINAYVESNSVQHLIGMGADTWDKQFPKYAHNTLVSYLFELGMLGFLSLAFIFTRTLLLCLSGPLTTYSAQLFLGFSGFIVMNMGTMPLWQIEGMILFAVLSAFAWELKLKTSMKTVVDPAETDISNLAGEPT